MSWIPSEQRVQSGLWRGETHMRQREWFAAYRAFLTAAHAAEGDDRELARGLVHAAAAGHKRLRGDERGRARQLAHARRRLAPFLPQRGGIDLEELLQGL
jgi:hypothetical protein